MGELETLRESGLSEAEAKVYIALLETNTTLAGPLIKKTGLHKGTTYQVIQRLIEKGLVSSAIHGKKQYFSPANPERIMNILIEKEKRLQTIIPDLQKKLSLSKEKQEVTVFSGVKGIRTVMDKMLNDLTPNGEYFDFGVSGLFREVMKEYWEIWQKEKKKRKIKSKIIFNEDLKKTDKNLLKYYHGKMRFQSSEYASLTDTIIYKDNVVLFIWTAKPPIAVVIKNKDNAKSYANQFKALWKASKE